MSSLALLLITAFMSAPDPKVADPRPLKVGQRVASRLTSKSELDQFGRATERWSFRGKAGDALVLDVRARFGNDVSIVRVVDGVSTVVYLSEHQYPPADEWNPTAMVGFTQVRAPLVDDGDYVLSVSSFYDKLGSYVMTSRFMTLPQNVALRPLGLGHLGEATFTKADPRDAWGARYHLWRFSGRAGQTVMAHLSFRGAIELGRMRGGVFEPLSHIDDEPRIELPSDGEYAVKVAIDKRWWKRAETNIARYRVLVVPVNPRRSPVPLPADGRVSGELRPDDNSAESERFGRTSVGIYTYDEYVMPAKQGESWLVEVTPLGDVDVRVSARDWYSYKMHNPRTMVESLRARGESARLAFTMEKDDMLTIRVARVLGPTETLDDVAALPLSEADARLNAWGAYQLNVTKRVIPPPAKARPLPLGETQARFDASDAFEQDDIPYHLWSIDAKKGEEISVAVTSDGRFVWWELGRLSADGGFVDFAFSYDGYRKTLRLPDDGPWVVRTRAGNARWTDVRHPRYGSYRLTFAKRLIGEDDK